MPRLDRSKVNARRRSAPAFDCLEGRQLLNATPVTHHIASTVHAAVKTTHDSTVHAAVKATHTASKSVHAAVKVKASHAVKTTPSASTTTHEVKLSSKLFHASKNKLIDLDTYSPPSDSGDSSGQVTYSPVVGAYTPSQLQTAYGINLLGLANQGQGVTIGIVDEYDDTAITADANAYSAQYNLPQFDGLNGDPTMSVVKDTFFGAVTSIVGTGVGGETSLDVEVAHAMAPKANILLVEVPATGTNANAFAELLHGVQLAASSSVNGVPVATVSLSYGLSEGSIGNANVVSLDSTYLSQGAATGVSVTVSTGDGSTPLFPATSPNVIGVGGTSLYLASARGRYSYETAWGGLSGAGAGGGGSSTNFASPVYQTGLGFAKRSIPDISMVADPVTAVSIYDSIDETANAPSPWGATGGTSVASPLFSGVLALVQQQRIAAGQPLLNSSEINTADYEAYNSPSYSTYFHDITLGSNKSIGTGRTVTGFTAKAGYDQATGIGSPIANTLVPYLANYVIGT